MVSAAALDTNLKAKDPKSFRSVSETLAEVSFYFGQTCKTNIGLTESMRQEKMAQKK